MKTTKQHIDPHELLVKYITGEANAAEKLQVEKWIAASDENSKAYDHFKLIWNESQKLAHNSAIDEDKAWGRFRERIQREYTEVTKPAFNYQWLKVAAVVLLVSAAALFGVRFFSHNKETVRYATTAPKPQPIAILKSITTNQIKVDTLPDGTTITQNKNSALNYPATFAGRTRNIELTGEAFFNVKHDPGKPFIIKVNDVLITVLGTSFNVKSTGKITEVIVETGVVSVTRKQQTVTLYPGEKITTIETGPVFKKEQIKDKGYRYYFDEKALAPPAKEPVQKKYMTVDSNKYHDLIKIIKDSSKLAIFIKGMHPGGNDLPTRRAVIKDVINDMVAEHLVDRQSIRSFRLDESEFRINDIKQPDAVYSRFKGKYIKEPGYVIYFGDDYKNYRVDKGVSLSPDSL